MQSLASDPATVCRFRHTGGGTSEEGGLSHGLMAAGTAPAGERINSVTCTLKVPTMVAREGLVAENAGNSAGAELLRGRVQRSGKKHAMRRKT